MQKYNLTCSEYKALLTIEDKESLPCKVLADKMGLSESRGNRVINRLIKQGYFRCSFDNKDKRVIYVSINKKGKMVKSKIKHMMAECEKEINNKLSESEIKNFINLINKVNKVLINN